MSALEQELFDKIRRLDDHAKRQLLRLVDEQIAPKPMDYAAWFQRARALREQLRLKYGEAYQTGLQDLIDEARDEASGTWLNTSS